MFWTTKQFFMMKGLPFLEPPKQIQTKQVRFSDKSRIILIPDRTEYCTVKNDMWYSDYDYYKFKNSRIWQTSRKSFLFVEKFTNPY